MATKFVYLFSEGNGKMRELLGGKGANLAEMTNLGMPVPQGFTITTEACTQYYEDGRQSNDCLLYTSMSVGVQICTPWSAPPHLTARLWTATSRPSPRAFLSNRPL